MKHYEVWENGGGGLSLYVFDESGICNFCRFGYEEPFAMKMHELAHDLELIREGADPANEWEAPDVDPQEAYEREAGDIEGALIADESGTYPRRMGCAGREAFEEVQ